MKIKNIVPTFYLFFCAGCVTTSGDLMPANLHLMQGRLDKQAAPLLKVLKTKCGEVIADLKAKVKTCDFSIQLRDDLEINAYASGESVIVTAGLMKTVDDLSLSLIIAHELGHNVLGHTGMQHSEENENKADKWGMYVLAYAGLDYAKAGTNKAAFKLPTINTNSVIKHDNMNEVSEAELARQKRRATHFNAIIVELDKRNISVIEE